MLLGVNILTKNNIKKFQIFSAIFVMILGTLLHFTYDLSGQNKFIGLFSAVNESTWEHLKLLFFPMLLSILVGYFYFRNTEDICNPKLGSISGKYCTNCFSLSASSFVCAKTVGLIVSMVFTIVFFYTYTGILGKNIAFIDILSFYVSVILGEYVSYKLAISLFKCNSHIAFIVLALLTVCFFAFTFKPLKIGLFKDPITGNYGILSDRAKILITNVQK